MDRIDEYLFKNNDEVDLDLCHDTVEIEKATICKDKEYFH